MILRPHHGYAFGSSTINELCGAIQHALGVDAVLYDTLLQIDDEEGGG